MFAAVRPKMGFKTKKKTHFMYEKAGKFSQIPSQKLANFQKIRDFGRIVTWQQNPSNYKILWASIEINVDLDEYHSRSLLTTNFTEYFWFQWFGLICPVKLTFLFWKTSDHLSGPLFLFWNPEVCSVRLRHRKKPAVSPRCLLFCCGSGGGLRITSDQELIMN